MLVCGRGQCGTALMLVCGRGQCGTALMLVCGCWVVHRGGHRGVAGAAGGCCRWVLQVGAAALKECYCGWCGC
jgi:hypothetical protein